MDSMKEELSGDITFTQNELSILYEILQFSISHTKHFMEENDDEETKEDCEKELRLLNSMFLMSCSISFTLFFIFSDGIVRCSFLTEVSCLSSTIIFCEDSH